MHEMSEEEQLQAAMRASLQEVDDGNVEYEMENDDDDDDDEVQIVDPPDINADLKPPAVDIKQEAAPSIVTQLLSLDIGDEPEKGARIQFRMPDGKRKIRKVDPSQTVRLLYAFVAVSNE
jgi:hypothetical protein